MGLVKIPLLDYLLHNHGASYNPIAGLPVAQSWGWLKSHCWITSCTLKEPVILWPGQKPLLGSSHTAHSDLESDFKLMEKVQLQSDCTWWPGIRLQMNGKSWASSSQVCQMSTTPHLTLALTLRSLVSSSFQTPPAKMALSNFQWHDSQQNASRTLLWWWAACGLHPPQDIQV